MGEPSPYIRPHGGIYVNAAAAGIRSRTIATAATTRMNKCLGLWAGIWVAGLACAMAPAASPAASTHPPRTHRLEATPATVVYGYYWADAAPVLHIDSGDIIDVDTLITNTPEGLAKAGVPAEQIQSSLKTIVSEVTGERRGPGGHILTGPVYVEGTEPGDVLEVKVLSI